MSSTFGALNTAFGGLTAANKGLSVTGQNIANAGTAGYTRQRIESQSLSPIAQTGPIRSSSPQAGQGVTVTGIARLGDAVLDNKVRVSAATAGYTAVRAETYSQIEDVLSEPGPNGISARLDSFWASWQDLSNNATEAAPAGALLQDAASLTSQINSGYNALENQWTRSRGQLDTQVAALNVTAAQVADLNGKIRESLAGGGSPNELIDQRTTLTTNLAALAGATVRDNADGTADVLIGGNALVAGSDAHTVRLTGSTTMTGASADPVRIEWADRVHPGLSLSSGEIAGAISSLAGADATGTGGPIAEAAESFNALATQLSTMVNSVHRSGVTPDGRTGLDFFATTAGQPAARSLSLVATSGADLASGEAGKGGHDGSIASLISQTGVGTASPDASWSKFVTRTGVDSRAALQNGTLAENLANAASDAQLSGASVSLDDESMNLLAYQRAYQANARVMTALDDMLDTLISRTGLVGR